MSFLRGLVASSPALALTMLGLGCAGSTPSPSAQLDVYVDYSQCVMPAGCNARFGLFVLRGGCVYAWATKMGGGGELALEPFDLEEGTVQVLATCGTESCVRCWASESFAEERRVDLVLQPVVACAVPQAVTTQCSECGPADGSYCDGDHRVTCVDGRTRIETCPEGCAAGACGACTTTTFYRDIDGDTYGDPSAKLESCTPPRNYVTNDTDCDDTDPDAHPQQTAFFTRPTLSNMDFDFDCNEVEEKLLTETQHCYYDTESKTCTGHGWLNEVPDCGLTGSFIKCSVLVPFLCHQEANDLQQACR
jgi:hypothetical protein